MDVFTAALQALVKDGGWRGVFEVLMVLAIVTLWRAYLVAERRHEQTLREMADVARTLDGVTRMLVEKKRRSIHDGDTRRLPGPASPGGEGEGGGGETSGA